MVELSSIVLNVVHIEPLLRDKDSNGVDFARNSGVLHPFSDPGSKDKSTCTSHFAIALYLRIL